MQHLALKMKLLTLVKNAYTICSFSLIVFFTPKLPEDLASTQGTQKNHLFHSYLRVPQVAGHADENFDVFQCNIFSIICPILSLIVF